MQHLFSPKPQFYLTQEQPCPYIEGRLERKLFTSIKGRREAQKLNTFLSLRGFRRSQNVFYRPYCKNCSACTSVRIDVNEFTLSKSQTRTVRKNADLTCDIRPTWASERQYRLFCDYLNVRHKGGSMANMEISDFIEMIEETPIRSRMIEYTQPITQDSHTHKGSKTSLIAACLTDISDDGLSMVYSFFKPQCKNRSLGKFMILDHIRLARKIGLPYVYLGYWVKGSRKMDYKSEFSALEAYDGEDWIPVHTNST